MKLLSLSIRGMSLIVLMGVIAHQSYSEVTVENAAEPCQKLTGKNFADASIKSSKLVKTDDEIGEYCEIAGIIPPKLNFKLRMPSHWNGKFHYSGGGGFNGYIASVNESAINQGYADVASDSGHSSFIPNPLSADFARDDEHALRLFAYQSVPTVAAVAKAIVTDYYQSEISHSYFEGCSNGGREGLTALLKNPDLFDGAVIKAPARQFLATYPFSQRNARLLEIDGARIGKGKLKMVSQRVLEQCDTVEKDGLVDGMIANTAACDFDADTLRCPDGEEGDDCLSDPQLAVVKSYTTPIVAAGGVLNYPAFPFHGREADYGQWDIWLYGTPMRWPVFSSIGKMFLKTGVKNLLAKSDDVDVLTWDFENPAYREQIQKMVTLIDRTDADLSAFADSGGKLILWQGSSDVAVTERGTTQYYKNMIETMGQEKTREFSRYYIAPAVNHCFGGVGASDVSQLLPALDQWVVEGKAPQTLIAHDKNKSFSRPLCVYPGFARYIGQGDQNKAENFVCTSK